MAVFPVIARENQAVARPPSACPTGVGIAVIVAVFAIAFNDPARKSLHLPATFLMGRKSV